MEVSSVCIAKSIRRPCIGNSHKTCSLEKCVITHKASIAAPDSSAPNTTYYAAIITTYGSGDDMKYYAEKGSITTGEDGEASYIAGLGKLDSAEAAAGAWQSASVPEPTTGLLMLVGLAGLALRRRRA